MKKLLRLTRHEFTLPQRIFLEERYGVLTVTNYPASVDRSKMVELNTLYKPDLVEVTLPIPLVAAALQVFKCPIIRTVMSREVLPGGRRVSHFSHYEHIKELQFEKVNL